MQAAWVLLVALPWLAAAGADRIVLREPAPLPEWARAPLPARLTLEELSTTKRLRSNGLMRLPQHQQLTQELCRSDSAARSRLLDGAERALAEPGQPLRTAYLEILSACPAEAHCAWLVRRAEEAKGPLRELLWSGAAQCWPLGDPARFESDEVPDGAVVSFHARRRSAERTHSPRLASLVEARAASGDPAALRDPLSAYAFMDHPETAARLLRLQGAASDPELARMLTSALRGQSDPAAAERFEKGCRRDLEERMRSWSAAGREPRASPFRFGDPCRASSLASGDGSQTAPATPPAPDPLGAVRSLGRAEWLSDTPASRLGDQSLLLRRLIELVGPELDEAVIEDVWPAVDEVSLERGPLPAQIFLDGDAMMVGVPGRGGRPDLAVAERIGAELEAALLEARALDVWFRGEHLRFRYQPDARRYDIDAALGAANWLLERADSELRVARVVTGAGFAVLAGSAASIERGAADGLLGAAAP